MNIERLQTVRDTIAANADQYEQDQYLHPCGSPACIAGWAAHLSLKGDEILTVRGPALGSYVVDENDLMEHVETRAREWLDLAREEAIEMFWGEPIDYRDDNGMQCCRPSTVEEALAMLDNAIKREKVEWPDLSA